jgi:hypothetical protein
MSYCPYFDERYSQCNFFNNSQSGSQKENYCLSSDNWKRCANYSNRSYDEKVSKRLRPNPEL